VNTGASCGQERAPFDSFAGPVIIQDGDYFGSTVNVAARIAAYAREVLSSDHAVQAADGLPSEIR
jgi:class 3 adenylate cyclase